MVVLVGQSDNVTVNLTRDDLSASGIFNDTHLPRDACITGVVGYDIESDGTIGTLAIIGEISNDSKIMCVTKTTQCKLGCYS